MNDLKLALTRNAMAALAMGHELVFDVDQENRITISCTDEAVREYISVAQGLALQMLPTDGLPKH